MGEADPDLRLRVATEDDLAGIAELYLATRADAVPAMPPIAHTPDEVRHHVAHWDLEVRQLWVAEDDLGLAGYALLTSDWLDGLYVGPDRQGRGVGSALLDLVKGLRPGGFSLWVFVSNAAARGFYHRHGLVELEITDGSGNDERSPDVHMAWPGSAPIDYLRGQIDATDRELAEVLARRFALTAAVQGYKPRGGQVDRDPDREREIAERMAAHVPGLAPGAVAAIMDAVIGESLSAWERDVGLHHESPHADHP